MNKKLYEALKTIGEVCEKHESCYDCELASNKFGGALCVFKHLNPCLLSTKIVKTEVYDLDESIR